MCFTPGFSGLLFRCYYLLLALGVGLLVFRLLPRFIGVDNVLTCADRTILPVFFSCVHSGFDYGIFDTVSFSGGQI